MLFGGQAEVLEYSRSPGTELSQINSYAPNIHTDIQTHIHTYTHTDIYWYIPKGTDRQTDGIKKKITLCGMQNTVISSNTILFTNAMLPRIGLYHIYETVKKAEHTILSCLRSILTGLWAAKIPITWEFPMQLSVAGNSYHKLTRTSVTCFLGKVRVLFQIV
jgi:hypothetical protein